jgi:serine/threonine protein kinase
LGIILQSNHYNNEPTRSYSALVEGYEVGRYSIIRKIGSGGMGEVYLAQDTELDRKVALKFLPDRLLNDDQAKARFRREAQATARLNHPNIVTIHEVSEHRGNPFFAMEFIAGETLDRKIKKAALSPEETTAIVIQVARALQAAHDQGIIHRDIKPGNICICHDGRVKVLDFGLARIVDSDSLTHSHLVLGTIGYNSPEQIKGEPVDGRTDIWSLGILICRMLTQKSPFAGTDAEEIMYSITHAPAMDISATRHDIPSPVRILYRRCLEKKPGKRPQSMAEVLNILGVEADTPEGIYREGRNQPAKKMLLAFLGVIFIAVFIWSLRSFFPDNQAVVAGETRRVGILPFHNQTSAELASAWPSIIQVLFVGNLTGIEDIGVIDPLSLNAVVKSRFDTDSPPRGPNLYKVMREAGVAYVIDGMIVRAGNGFKIQANIIEPLNGEVVYSCAREMDNEANLPVTVDSLSKNILGFFQTRILEED